MLDQATRVFLFHFTTLMKGSLTDVPFRWTLEGTRIVHAVVTCEKKRVLNTGIANKKGAWENCGQIFLAQQICTSQNCQISASC